MLRDLFLKHPRKSKNFGVPRRLILVTVVLFGLSVLFPIQIVRAEKETKESSSCSTVVMKVTCYVLQPFYLIGKSAVAITGTVISFVTLVATVGDEEAAKKILDDSLAGPWGIPGALEKIESDSSQSG